MSDRPDECLCDVPPFRGHRSGGPAVTGDPMRTVVDRPCDNPAPHPRHWGWWDPNDPIRGGWECPGIAPDNTEGDQ